MSDAATSSGRQVVLAYHEGRREVLSSAPPANGPTQLFGGLARAAIPGFARWVAVVDPSSNVEFSHCVVDHQHSLAQCAQRWADGLDVRAEMDEVTSRGASSAWPVDERGERRVVAPLTGEERTTGAVLFSRGDSDPAFSRNDLDAIYDVVTALGVDLERLELRHQSRLALRASQRVASQLHQLISASLAVGTLDDEFAIAQTLARSARGVFDADRAVLVLGEDDGSIVGSAQRGRIPRVADIAGADNDLPERRPLAIEPWTQGDWLCAPVLDSQRRSRGMVAVRRSATVAFGDEDRELAMLLGQLAATSLEALGLTHRIRDNEARLRILVDAAPVSIVESDATGRIRLWNQSASRLLRWPEFSAHNDGEVDWPEDVREVLATLWRDVLVGGLHDNVEFTTNFTGRERLLTGSVAVLPSGGDSPSLLTLLDDITDQRELREEVRHAHRMELRGQVASSVAHDFNNLITLILGYAELLSRHVAGDETSRALVEEIQATSSRASKLTAQLQSIGRTEPTAPVRVDVTEMLRRNAEVLERIMGSNTVVEWELADATPDLTVDADLFEQMILNLCVNARDAMPDGGSLMIRTEVHELSFDTSRAPSQHVMISITDTGVGMDEATRARCFEPLFTTKGPFKGTGLGLASARRLVEESDGVITCDSTLGEGTTFTVWLPSHDARQHADDDVVGGEGSQEETPSPRTTRDAIAGTVLLCEDDDALRRLARHALQRSGLSVLEAISAEDALEVLARYEGPLDLLVSDIVLPEMSGQQLAERLQGDRPDLMVVLMSGTASRDVIDLLVPGSAIFIAKPFRPSEFIDGVLTLLRKRTNTSEVPLTDDSR